MTTTGKINRKCLTSPCTLVNLFSWTCGHSEQTHFLNVWLWKNPVHVILGFIRDQESEGSLFKFWNNNPEQTARLFVFLLDLFRRNERNIVSIPFRIFLKTHIFSSVLEKMHPHESRLHVHTNTRNDSNTLTFRTEHVRACALYSIISLMTSSY